MTTNKYLKSLQTKLLDLTYRNRLLNFKYSAKSTLRVVNEIPHFLFEKLRNDSRLIFVPVPEPKEKEFVDGLVKVKDKNDPSIEKEVSAKLRPPVKEYAQKIGIDPSFELERSYQGKTAKSFIDNEIQTLLYPDDLERILTRIYGLAKSAIEETGNNLLHITFGALEYTESEVSQEKRISPLVVLPVELVRTKPDSGEPFFSFVVSSSGEGPTPNISLIEKMKADFGINFPVANFEASEEENVPVESLENYLAMIEDVISKSRPLWKVKSEVNLCILNFGKLVLHRDLNPENWSATNLGEHPLIKALVNGQEESQSDSFAGYAEDHSIDKVDPRLLPRLIYDADSSQHSAMVDVFARKSLVIEGPPGTGKSQTITNIIAAAIGEGKHVLFIAEKLAALQVVKKRLDEAGLGDFCLELHSTKIQKRAVLDSLKRRISTPFMSTGRIDIVRSNFEEAKAQVNDYVNTINKIPHGVKETYLQCVGKYSNLKVILSEKGFENVESIEAKIEIPHIFDELKFDRDLDLIRDYSYLSAEIVKKYGDLKRHPWSLMGLHSKSKLRNQALISEFERISSQLSGLESAVEALNCKKYGLTNEDLIRNLDLYLQIGKDTKSVRATFNAKNVAILKALTFDSVKNFAEILSDFIKVGKLIERKNLEILSKENVHLSDIEFVELANSELSEYADFKLSEILSLRNLIDGLTKELNFVIGWHSKAHLEIFKEAELSTECIQIVDELINRSRIFVEKHPNNIDQLFGFLPDFSSLREISELIFRNSELKKTLDEVFISTVFESPIETVLQKLDDLQNANWFNSLFIKKYKEAKAWLRGTLIDNSDISYTKNAVPLNKLRQYLIFKHEIEKKSVYSKLVSQKIEISRDGLQNLTDGLNYLKGIIDQYGRIRTTESFQFSTLKSLASNERISLVIVEAVKAAESSLRQLKIHLPALGEITSCIVELKHRSQKFERIVGWKFVSLLSDHKLSQVREPLEIVCQFNEFKSLVEQSIGKFDGYQFQTQEKEKLLAELDGIVFYVQKIKGFEIIASAENQFYEPAILSVLNELETNLSAIQVIRFEVFNKCNELGITRFDVESLGIGTFSELIERALANRETLYEFENYAEIQGKLSETIFGRIIPILPIASSEPSGLRMLCEFLYYRSVLNDHLERNNSLSYFDNVRHENIRGRFRSLDKELIVLNRAEIAFQLSRHFVPRGNSTGKKSTWTDLALIEREIEKVQRHIPLRQLVKRSGPALQALKPCFMMSPLTVAQFLPPNEIDFDLVVIDEASQIKPEDSFGAIARAKQVVVVGDTKQLPPTSFFDSSMEDGDDIEEEFESILEQAAGTFRPARRLRWHYRSKHESLIAFSNSQFYDNDLVLFPSAKAKHDDLGVKLRKIENGIYDGNGKNLIEARALVEGVKQHAHRYASQTLGVVTMNIAQKELIEDLLFNEAKSDPVLSEFINRGEGTSEEFFVKNLESVQGDEKDVIFISVTYGKDKAGAFHLRFGPINSKNGYRRLNVLFSRAKERMEIFCSFEPTLIPANSSRGANALRDFLEFAGTGLLKTPVSETGRTFDSPFEKSVANALEAKGYLVKAQVGVAGYFVDIGIQHPDRPGEYVLGIECDGATYHSSKSARDRDRLRQENLEKLGWKIHRIWSTDWFRNERREIESAVRKIESMLTDREGKSNAKSESIDFSKPSSSNQELKRQLVNFREQIYNEMPQVPRESGILRKRILDQVLTSIPHTETEFLDMLKENQLAVHNEHLVYLPEILALICSKNN